jgi:hypothetical protein
MGRRKRNNDQNGRRERQFRIRGVRKDPPDMRKLGRALLGLAAAEAEREAQAAHEAGLKTQRRRPSDELASRPAAEGQADD